MLHLLAALLCDLLFLLILLHTAWCIPFSSEKSVDGFIAETQEKLKSMWSSNTSKRLFGITTKQYNLTDDITYHQRSIKLLGFCILTHSRKKHMQIMSGVALDSPFNVDSFMMTIHSDLQAYILDINAVPSLTGTETMTLVHYILSRIGVKRCSLQNCAKLRYEYQPNPDSPAVQTSIPLIHLRCIRGKSSDWYADFGYFNENAEEIADTMWRIHDIISPHNCSFGPWLRSLWETPDRSEFHRIYQYNKWRLMPLTKLRDSSPWHVHFQ